MNDQKKIISDLEALDERLLKAIEKILGKNPSKEQLLQFLASEEFDKLIGDLGLNKIAKDYASGFNFSSTQDMKDSGLTHVQETIARIDMILELIKNANGRTVLGYFGYQKENLRRELINSLVHGKKFEDTVKSFGAEIIGQQNPSGAYWMGQLHVFSEANVRTVIGTSYFDYSRSVTRQTWIDQPEQRFKYVGGIIPTSSDECKWLMENQKSEGYTIKEIDAGIETPFIYKKGGNKGEVKRIWWWGRFPNYNCIHAWGVIDKVRPTTNKYDEVGRRIK